MHWAAAHRITERPLDRVQRMQRALARHAARVHPASAWDKRIHTILARSLAESAAELIKSR